MPGILARLRMVVGLEYRNDHVWHLIHIYAFSAILYFTTTHIESYQVTSGPLSRNETYTGLAIREESLCKADSSGYITYYAREAVRSMLPERCTDLVIQKQLLLRHLLPRKNFQRYGLIWWVFPKDSVQVNLNSTYSFKYELKGNILQYAESGNTSSAPLTSDEDGEGNDSGDKWQNSR